MWQLEGASVGGMIDPIIDRDIGYIEGIDALKTPYVVTVLLRVQPTLMMRIDPALRAKVVFGGFSIELVELEMILALDDSDSGKWY
jgi:hypothetical protein